MNAIAPQVDTETTTFRAIQPKLNNMPKLQMDSGKRVEIMRYIHKLDKHIKAVVDLKDTLTSMNVRSNILGKEDTGYTPYPDSDLIPQWMQGADSELDRLSAERDVYLFNVGEPCAAVPASAGGVSPDFVIRALCLRSAGYSDEAIMRDRARLQDGMVS